MNAVAEYGYDNPVENMQCYIIDKMDELEAIMSDHILAMRQEMQEYAESILQE